MFKKKTCTHTIHIYSHSMIMAMLFLKFVSITAGDKKIERRSRYISKSISSVLNYFDHTLDRHLPTLMVDSSYSSDSYAEILDA